MSRTAHFKVDPKLTQFLGENYTSSEKALKELIDNAWEAEANEVHVTVPNILTEALTVSGDKPANHSANSITRSLHNSPSFSILHP